LFCPVHDDLRRDDTAWCETCGERATHDILGVAVCDVCDPEEELTAEIPSETMRDLVFGK
jgi:hypothetical protein